MFNILIIVAGSALVAGRGGGVLQIDWRPVVRDVSFYSISVLVLIFFFDDSVIDWYEGMIMVLMYMVYILFMKFNSQIFEMCPSESEKKTSHSGPTDDEKKAIEMVEKSNANRGSVLIPEA